MALLSTSRRFLQYRKSWLPNSRSIGYVVLLPEIGDAELNDQLSQKDNLPEFNNVTIEYCTALIAKQALEFESGVKKIEKDLVSQNGDIVDTVLKPLEILSTPLEVTWGISKTLYLGNNTSVPTKTYLPIHERARRARSSKYNNLSIYQAVQNELSLAKDVNVEVKSVLNKFLLEGKLNGLGLESSTDKEIFNDILMKISKEKEIFKKKIDNQTEIFSHTIKDYNIVRDFPKELLHMTSTDSKNTLNGPWKITLQPTIYLPTMQHCSDRDLRWNLWQALVNRGSGYLEKNKSTGKHIEEIRSKRQELAKLLGYKTFADMSMETKMARSVENIQQMMNTILVKAKPAQDAELKYLHDFAMNNGFKYERIELWDVPYWRKRQELEVHKYDPDELKKYFPFTRVLKGLFGLCENLFDIVIKQRNDVSTWHKDVKFFDIYETHCSAPVAGFYLDPYGCTESGLHNMNSKGWMVAIQNKSQTSDKIPLASLIFNFDAPLNGKQSHLSVKDVHSLFYKVGHALQHLLTRTSFSEVAGHSNIEWDAVEVCGHVLSHFLYTPNVMQSISYNLESDKSLPKHLMQSMFEVRKHMAGLDLCKELYLSTLDLELYSSNDYWLKIVKNLWPQFRSFPLDKNDSHLCSFTQIFTEEWPAAYYSHIWSRMIAADVYSAFEEIQGNDKETVNIGKRYRDTYLALGGSIDATKVFRRFRGRDPSPEAFLKWLGLN